MVSPSTLSHAVEMMTRVASLYYLEDATQAQIADQLGLSRPKVGRLLKRARAEGIVEITVHAHPTLDVPLETELMQRFGLQQVLLASDQGDPVRQRAVVAQMAAGYLGRHIEAGTIITVGMGRNTGAVPEHVASLAPRACTFVSALGGSPQIGQPINPDTICRRLADRFGGDSESLYAPAYAESREVRESLMSHEDIRQTLNRARQAQIALVGIGDAREDSAVVRIGCVSSQEIRQLRQDGAVGDILGYFFDAHGRPVAHSVEDRVIGLGPEDLRRIPCVVGIASESDKAQAILGALRTGILNVLATSTGNARSVLALDAGDHRSS